jgi:hypothetical protein
MSEEGGESGTERTTRPKSSRAISKYKSTKPYSQGKRPPIPFPTEMPWGQWKNRSTG